MPRIPMLDTQVSNPNVPDLGQGPSVARAGQAWDALSRVGGAMSSIGNDLLKKRKEAEISSYVVSSKADIERRVTEFDNQLKDKYAGKDPSGYASEMNEFLNTLGTDIMDAAPSDDAKAAFELKFQEISQNIGMAADAHENKERAFYQSGLIDKSSQADRALLIRNPNPEKASSMYANTLEGINAGVGLFWDQQTAQKMIKEQAAAYGETYLEGAIQNKRFGDVIRFADGKDENGKIFLENMDPSRIQKYKGEALRKMEAEAEVSKALLGRRMNDISMAIQTGREPDANMVKQARSQMALLKPEERAYLEDDLNVTLQYGQLLKEARGMKISDIQKAASLGIDHGNDSFNLASRMSARKRFEEGLKSIIDEKVNKPGDFYASQDEEIRLLSKQALDLSSPESMRSYAEVVTAKNKQEGGPGTKILTTEMSKTYGSMLKAKKPEAVNMVRDAIANGFGEAHYGKVIAEMVANKDIDQDLAMALYLPDPELRKRYISNIANKKEIDEDFARRPKEVKTGLKELFEDPEVQNLKAAINNGGGQNSRLWLNNSLDSGLELNYKALIASGESPKDAKAKALEMVAGNWTAASSGKSNVVVPKQFQGFKSNIEDFMDASLATPSLRKMDIQVPVEYQESPLMIGKDPAEIQAKYIEDVSKHGRWVSNSNQTGAMLVKINDKGESVPVRDGSGSIVQRSFTEMRDNGLAYGEEIKAYNAEIESLREEAKTSVRAAGRIATLKRDIALLRSEQRKRNF